MELSVTAYASSDAYEVEPLIVSRRSSTRSLATEESAPSLVACEKDVMNLPIPSSAPVRITSAIMTSISVMPLRRLMRALIYSPLSRGRPDNGTSRCDPSTAPPEWRASRWACLLYTSDAADDLLCVDLG